MAACTAEHRYFFNPHYTPILLLIFLLPSVAPPTLALNITALLAGHADLSSFAKLLASSTVIGDLSGRSSLTLLAVPNPFLLRSAALHSANGDIADVLRYHVLLEYLSWTDLRRIPPKGKLITTLYQTTGRAPNNLGAINLTRDPIDGVITACSPAPFFPSNATILSLVTTLPYNISVFSVNALMIPYGFDLAASETRPSAAVNITQVLIDGRDFNVAASMLEASGVVDEFERDENGAGITIFVPTDEAFAGLPATDSLQSLPAERKAVVLRFHVLHSYYPLGSLESIVNPVQPTLATEDSHAGWFTLNISRVNGSVAIDTGVVQATITRTVYDQNPVAVFAVSRVLLPKQVFGKGTQTRDGFLGTATQSPEAAPPEEGKMSPTRLTTPPGIRQMISAAGVRSGFQRWSIYTGLMYFLLLAGDLCI
ncbi:Fasciclin-like arabinogalactan protein 4 [Platanthera zijinensis]|uniref:Fasciclin-like arabinogalactan protein 4 n=1 Tax=Platanthera zijinensis TaxID=2320716 RepID=A0AAP0BVX0_9ASPA